MKLWLTGLCCLCLSGGVLAQNVPHQSGKDIRVQEVNFKKNDVIPISVPIFTNLHVSLDESEVIESIQSGDSQAWNIYQHKRYLNQFFIKPTAPQSSSNLTVLTEKNVYYFTLNVKEQREPGRDILGLEVKLPKRHKPLSKPARLYCVNNKGNINVNYAYHGNGPFRPHQVCDDGINTYFVFNKNQSIPAIFKVIDRKGHEAIVNHRTKGNVVMVREINRQWTLREGNFAISVFKTNVSKRGRHG